MTLRQKIRRILRFGKVGSSGKRLNRSVWGDIFLFFFLGLFGLFSAWPLIFVINNAFKPLNEIFLFPPKLFVQNPTTSNFRDMFNLMSNSWIPFSRYIFNTLFITLIGTSGSVFISSLAAFPLAKFNFPGSKTMSKMIVYSLMFSGAVTGIPNFVIISKLGLLDSYWAVLLPTFSSSLGLFLMRNFMTQIPTDLIESAKMDGASDFYTYLHIIMPLAKPAWLTLIILQFQSLWGATGGSFIYSEKLKPLSYGLSQIANAGVARTGVVAAVSLFMLIVPISVFIISQSQVIETMASSGIKD
ncbi:MAG: carbohydrate ABC transporter permease [Bacilli bacterium]|nr:carbohydrate ABC transporter permease [Bacilli bacterium]